MSVSNSCENISAWTIVVERPNNHSTDVVVHRATPLARLRKKEHQYNKKEGDWDWKKRRKGNLLTSIP